jgi:hypothetical protein
MPIKPLELDKTWTAGVGQAESYGTVVIRVVVVPPKENDDGVPAISDPDEPLTDAGSGPLDSYLERPRGEGYVVFLVHGQRHDSLDESFVHRELGYKYLRTRTMIVIDVDGLAPHAIAEVVQGSRQGMYKGDVTGVFCTSGSEREFTLEGSWYADEEIQAGADCDTAAAG